MTPIFLLFGTSLSLFQLAFGGVLNAVYSVVLLVVLVWVWRAHSKMRASQQNWYGQWENLVELSHKQIDSMKDVDPGELMGWMKSGWLTDLAARLESSMGLPSAEEASQQMMSCALHGKPYLLEEGELSAPWKGLSGLAILLGLLGTFIGLTFALTQLPFKGSLQQLTGGLQVVLPLMGTAFWTSVCGLLASLMLRFAYNQAVQYQTVRAQSYDQLHVALSRRCLRELFPLLTRAGLTGIRTHSIAEEGEQTAQEQDKRWEQLCRQLSLQQDTLLERLSAAFEPLQTQLAHHTSSIQGLPHELERVAQVFVSTETALQNWQEQLKESNQTFVTFASEVNAAATSIAHAEDLLTERVSGLARQQDAMTASLEALAEREREFPTKLRDILKLSLRPAHQSLQQTTRGLQTSLELIFEHDQQERATQRRLFQDLGERFAAVDRLTTAFEKNAREIRQISDSLVDLSNRLRFRLAIEPEAAEVTEDATTDQALDQEIEELLEGFDLPTVREQAGEDE